ncbi:MAG: hypothetical protein ACXACC_10990 [Promethearchaeota archaeon]|jgi:hydrogenase maturation factor HypF (carbamoyltransferase family)
MKSKKQLLNDLQNDLKAVEKLQYEKLQFLGYEKCYICDSWHKTDDLYFNPDIWHKGICEDCYNEFYAVYLENDIWTESLL